jgi:tetratricopeptide (TPR) repeat protein
MKKIFFIFISALLLCSCGPAPHLKTVLLNREGNQFLKNQNFPAAQNHYLEALQFNPFLAELHLNLGLTFEMLQAPDKALSSYLEAEKLAGQAKDAEMTFMARFNRAQLLGKDKKVDEAIAVYQSALDIIPSSKEVKTNIELLTQQQQGKGGGDSKDQNQDQKDNKNQDGKNKQDGKDGKDNKDQKKDQDQNKDQNKDKDGQDKKDQEKKEQGKPYGNSPKYKPRPFDGKELSESDVKKILGEIKQQESKIRADFNRKEIKEQPRDKDW